MKADHLHLISRRQIARDAGPHCQRTQPTSRADGLSEFVLPPFCRSDSATFRTFACALFACALGPVRSRWGIGLAAELSGDSS